MNALAKVNRLHGSTWGLDKSFRATYYTLLVLRSLLLKAKRGPQLQQSISALLSSISNYRILTRFTGLPATVAEAIEGPDGGDDLSQALAWTRTISMLFYYPLEHLAWAKDVGVIRSKRIDSGTLWVLSCRLWLVYIIAQAISRIRLLRTLQREAQRIDLSYDQRKDCAAKVRATKLMLICNASDFCLASNWSLRKSRMGDLQIGLWGMLGSAAGLTLSFS